VFIVAINGKFYKVFIASPGGLADERRAFKETVSEYNDCDAVDRRAVFLPVGWELTLPGVGRPQALINQDIETCDYFVLILWDRWVPQQNRELLRLFLLESRKNTASP
jgi:Domain of unknown function (DUF4062)